MQKKELVSLVGVSVITMLVLAAVVSALVPATGQTQTKDSNKVQYAGSEQVVQLSFRNGNYYPSTIYLKSGVPTKLIVDTQTVTGCMRTIVISSLGIRKIVKTGDNIIEFTPTQEGSIPFSCGMGMGRGVFVVTKDGTSDNQPVPVVPASSGSSCGSGGCGCGGA